MTRNRFAAALVPALLLPAGMAAPAPRARVQEAPDPGELLLDELDQQDFDLGESPERYAQVKAVEGDVTIRKGEADEPLTRGVPVAEGDVVESRGRGVLQLGDGSAVAFGPGTRFRVAALFSEADQERRVLLVLEWGQLRVCRGALSEAVLRVDTPSGSAGLGGRGARPDVTVEAARDPKGDKSVFRVHGGQATWTNAEGRVQVYAGQRLTVYGSFDQLDRVSDFNAYALDAFDQWAGDVVRPRPSESASRVPPEIRYYADDLDTTGQWSYVDEVGAWCWSPTAVDGDWNPYANGYWGAFGGGMTWVSGDPWGYVTCHHGRWGWRAGLGWYWIPGINYSPAWVAWQGSGPWFGWAPLGFRNHPVRWGRDRNPCWNVVDVRHVQDRNLHPWFRRDPAVGVIFNRPPERGARPWFQGRLVIDRSEIRDPNRFQRIVAQPGVIRERVAAYERTSGRTLPRPPAAPAKPQDRGGFTRLENVPATGRPVFQRPGTDERKPAERPRPEREEAPRMEINRREPIRTEQPKQEAPRAEVNRREPAKQETPHAEVNRREPAKQEAPRAEVNRREPAKQEAPRAEVNRREPAKQEAPRAEVNRREPAKQEAPRAEVNRREPARQESPRPAPAPRVEAPRPAPPPSAPPPPKVETKKS